MRSIAILSIVAALVAAPIAGVMVGGAVHAQGVADGAASVDAGPGPGPELDAGAAPVASQAAPAVVVINTPPSSPTATTLPDPADTAGVIERLRHLWERGAFRPFALFACWWIAWMLAAYVPWMQGSIPRTAAVGAIVETLQDMAVRALAGAAVSLELVIASVGSALLLAFIPKPPPKKPGQPPATGELGGGA